MKEKHIQPANGIFKLLFIAFSIPPLVTTVVLLIYYFHAWAIMGVSPPNGLDATNLRIYSTYEPFITISSKAWLIAFPLLLLYTTCYCLVRRKNIKKRWVSNSFLCHFISFLIVIPFVFWFGD